jgi:DNA-binding NtrC family response regulator
MLVVLSDFLEEEGYVVETARTTGEAITKFKNCPFDLVITEITLPDMNGLKMLNKLKDIDKLLSSIIMTAYSSLDTAIETIKVGVYDYIVKPVKLEVLGTNIQRVLEET